MQVAKYRAAASEVTSLSDLIAIARGLHEDDLRSGAVTAVTQLMAAAASDERVGRDILDRFQDWIAIVEDALKRSLETNPLASYVPVHEAAYAICAMFLGIELMSRLDPARSEAEALFDMMGAAAQLAETMLPNMLEQP
jgi:hypothetical protein